MNSLEWRVKRLENKVLGQANAATNKHVERILERSADPDKESLLNQLELVAKKYKSFSGSEFSAKYGNFLELYDKYKSLLADLENTSDDGDITAKSRLILAYEDDLLKYMHDIKLMADKADAVLNVDRWPDVEKFQTRLDKLQQITKEQHIQSVVLDKRTEELIGIYNDIIGSLKSNITIWNQKLEAYENEDKRQDDEEDN